MTEEQRRRLRNIKTFPQLIAFLRDELDWPIERGEDEDDLTFDWSDDLGLEASAKVGIKEIKQLRPLESGQPWGIFFINFEKKRLPIVILRRILNALVVKKRASANNARRAAWRQHDLLFISAYGEDDERQLTFAHFSEPTGELTDTKPTLRVLGWDDEDTNLKLDYVADKLKEKLTWPDDTSNLNGWRKRWSEAFEFRPRQVISTSADLALRLAELARRIRGRALRVLEHESEKGALRKLMKGFKTALIHDLNEDQFADMYAQTITYGLFSAAVSRTVPGAGTAVVQENVADMVPVTSPFLKEMLQSFLRAGGRKGKLDFDELGIQDVVELLNDKNTRLDAVLRDFGNRTQQEDPVIHFYENFLAAYDKKLKVQRGVFYTPQPVVSYIVRSVHELLQTEFGLADGLADTTTWGAMLKKHPGLRLPPLTDEPGEKRTISPDEPFVQILDPATGTATFLVEVIDVIHRTLAAKWKQQRLTDAQQRAAWNDYVPQHLLPRLHAFELMMAPYAIAHMKIGLKLAETGYRFGTEERARIYLTNALEPWVKQLPLIGFDALAHEAAAVNEIKRHKRFTVVIGNPPYSGISANMSEAIIDLVEPYKSINGVSLGERKIWAQDDYKKFIRISQLNIANAGWGILGFITNHGFISEPTSRGMRHNLLATFPRASVFDLHGSLKKREACPDGSPDKNVFDIELGVAISFLRRGGTEPNNVAHGEVWGLREVKYDYLLRHSFRTTKWATASPSADFYLFVPQSDDTKAEFSQLVSITEVFESGSNGIQTSRDHVVYGFRQAECRTVIEEFRSPESSLSTSEVREKYWPGKKVANYAAGDTRGWKVPEARSDVRRDKDWESKFRRTLYRPFDFRTLFYADYMIDWPRTEVMSQMLRPNLSLCVGRAGSAADNREWNIIFVADALVDMNLFYRGGNVSYPLRFAPVSGSLAFDRKPRPNFKAAFLKSLGNTLGLPATDDFGLPAQLTPEDIFHYAYAVLHSPGYRTRYAELLKFEFPRLPLTGSLELFRALARLGGELVALHLLESPKFEQRRTEFIGGRNPEVEKVSWLKNTVWINKAQTIGFQGVPEGVWNFHIGGYQVCEKWLKDRKGRELSNDDIKHYHRIVVALHETIRLMTEIDKLIEQHGGWPTAFVSRKKIR